MSKVKVKFIYGGDHTVSVLSFSFRLMRLTKDLSIGILLPVLLLNLPKNKRIPNKKFSLLQTLFNP